MASGYNIAKAKCPLRRHAMKSSEMPVESGLQSGKEPDYVLDLLKQFNLPVTLENYLGLAYPEGVPPELEESSLPPEIRNA